MKRSSSFLLLSLLIAATSQAQVTGYYRQPDVFGDRIVFNSEGDLWSVAVSGGSASRITSNSGQEESPTISPDGTQIAYAASYDGELDTYVLPFAGGPPTRISWIGARPVAWTADGRVVVRTFSFSGVPNPQLAIVDPNTKSVEQVPLYQAAEADLGPDGTIYFARMPRQGSNSRWYKGGTAQKLWSFKPGASEAVPLTLDYPGTSRQPNVLSNGRVYFLSDRKGAMNIWSMAPDGTDLRRHTQFEDWDIQELAGDGTTLVFRLGADLWRFDARTEQSSQIPVSLVTDRDRSLVDWETEPWNYVSDVAISPNGGQVALVSRGELFIAPVGTGRLVHASRDSGVRYRNVVYSSDSSFVYGLSDKSGELEWWKVPASGVEEPSQISAGPPLLRLDGIASPDGKALVHGARANGLWLVDLDTGESTEIASEPLEGDYAWSPDSRYIVYNATTPNQLSALYSYDTKEKQTQQLTSDRFSDEGPAFSVDGSWLYFTSNRTWNSTVGSPWGERAPQPHFEKQTKVYAVPLRVGTKFPNATPDELASAKETPTTDEDLRWDLASQLRELPIPAGSYSNLHPIEDRLIYRSDGDVMALDLKPDSKPIRLVEGASLVDVSANGKHVLLRKDSKLFVIPSGSSKDTELGEKNEVKLKDWKFAVNKRDEWTQIYNDAWRLHRDYFWDPNMLGVDWEAMREKYAPLAARVGSREALADVQGLLVSELSLMHSNAGGGDVRRSGNDVAAASLGGLFERDSATGGFRLVHRYVADPDLPDRWSPLAHPDAQIEEGSVILAINGQNSSTAPSLESMLLDQAGKQVRLSIRDRRGAEREVVVTPMSRSEERDLRYDEWELTRRLRTDSVSDGTIGYVHLRAMGSGDIGQWTREFYSQTNRQGLIVDVRHNNGGNIDSWVLSQLLRRAWAYFKPRYDVRAANMQYSFNGHLVVLVDERTASDGEAFADGFRRLGLGKAIGVRTWGGEVWLSSSNRQVDGGVARASETGVYGLDGHWLIEGWGFVPDMVVDNLPHETFNGKDAQLDAAISYLTKLISDDPRLPPKAPPYPTLVPGSGFPTPWAPDR